MSTSGYYDNQIDRVDEPAEGVRIKSIAERIGEGFEKLQGTTPAPVFLNVPWNHPSGPETTALIAIQFIIEKAKLSRSTQARIARYLLDKATT